MTRAKVLKVTPADENNQVVTVAGCDGYRKTPCVECPWRRSNAGSFPAQAYRISANCAEDGSMIKFGCHMNGATKAVSCAGFLLKNSTHNLGVRLSVSLKRIDFSQISDGGADLFDSYREMAVANGVPENDPAISNCRGDLE